MSYALERQRTTTSEPLQRDILRALKQLHLSPRPPETELEHIAARISQSIGTRPIASIDPEFLTRLTLIGDRRAREQLQRVLGYCGRFEDAVLVYRHGYPLDHLDAIHGPKSLEAAEVDMRLRRLIDGAVPQLIGNGIGLGGVVLQNDQPIIRVNIVLPDSDDQLQPGDIVYLNSGQHIQFEAEVSRRSSWALDVLENVKLFSLYHESRTISSKKLLNRISIPRTCYGVPLTGVQAIAELLAAGAVRVHLHAMDFYMSDFLKKPPRAVCAQLGNAVIWGQLDWVQGLYRRGLVTADDAGREVLEMSLEEYARRLEELYGDWSAERAPG